MKDLIKELEELKQNNMFRHISSIDKKEEEFVFINGKKLTNFSSNDYLGLSTNKDLVEEFCRENLPSPEFSFSSASARLLTGTSETYNTLEQNIAHLFNKEAALLFNTGFQCNMGVISALMGQGDVIFSDKLNHASIIDGMRLSDATFYRYKHLDYEHLETLLEKHRGQYKRAIIISESVFSMDGDIANIYKLIELKKKYNTLLMIDEAHAFCAIDDDCAGISARMPDVDIVTATFGKALSSFGAFVVADKPIIKYLVNKARSFIFSTAIPPINIMWTNWLLTKKFDYVKSQHEKLHKLVIQTHKYLAQSGIETISESQIIPVVLKTPTKAEEIAKRLEEEGFFVLPIRPPSVPIGTSRLRLSLTANINFEDVKRLLEIIKNEI